MHWDQPNRPDTVYYAVKINVQYNIDRRKEKKHLMLLMYLFIHC